MHVFVETNWLIDVARPFPAPEAQTLLERSRSGELQLHVPWVSVHEAKRTLDRIIREDLGFAENMLRFAVAEFKAGRLTPSDKPVVDQLAARGAQGRKTAIGSIGTTIDAVLGGVEIIAPSEPAITKTLALYSVKSLKPWDELVLGAVLTRAAELHAAGEREMFFCNLNTRDFAPAHRPELEGEYAGVGLQYLDTFILPRVGSRERRAPDCRRTAATIRAHRTLRARDHLGRPPAPAPIVPGGHAGAGVGEGDRRRSPFIPA